MATTNSSNSTLPNTFAWAGADSDQFDRAHVAYPAENFDAHTHRASYGLGVGRLTTTAVAAACDIAIDTDTLTWKNAANNATFQAMSLSGTQTVTGVKTFSGNNTHSGTLAISGVTTFTANPVVNSSNKITFGSGGTTTDIGFQRTSANTLTIDSAPTTGTANTVNIGTGGTSNTLNVHGDIKAGASLVTGLAGTTTDIAITKTASNVIKIDSYPNTGTANTVNIGTSGTSNVLNVYGTIYANAATGLAPFPLSSDAANESGTVTIVNATTWYATSASVSLAAGKWALFAKATLITTGAADMQMRIQDFTGTQTADSDFYALGAAGRANLSCFGTLTLTGTSTVRVEGYSTAGASSGTIEQGRIYAVRIG